MTITYRIALHEVQAHRLHVTLTVPTPAALQRVSLPVWIPGSYMVREFARHLSGLRATQGTRTCALRQIDKTTWEVACEGRAALVLHYEVYAFDTSVRAAFADGDRVFFNGTSVCLRVEGRDDEPHRLELDRMPRGWEVATAMPAEARRGREYGYVAADYHELIDHPFELGRFWRGSFTVAGVPHEFVVAGAWPGFDGDRLLRDTRKICAAEVALWHGRSGKPPFKRYVFMLNTVDDGYGGLEHRASTALIAARRQLPRTGDTSTPEGYATLLGLISHEYFHSWNVKRLKPAEFAALDYGRENYTELLWFFEGFTSYYDDLVLLRAGLVDAPRYLALITKTIDGVAGTPGARVQSVARSSFDAWIKYYRSDENTPNATISYYAKGSLIALALDLALRVEGRSTLDDVMRSLWRTSRGGPISQDDILQAVAAAGGRQIADDLTSWVHGTDDVPLRGLLAAAGVDWRETAPARTAGLGLRVSESALTGVQVKQVLRGGAAERAGLAAGDELIAVDGWRLRRLDDLTQWVPEGRAFELTLVRDQRLRSVRVDPGAGAAARQGVTLALAESPDAQALARRRDWLGA